MKTRTHVTACLTFACLFVASVTQAGMTVKLGGGWEVEIGDPSAIGINVDTVGNDLLPSSCRKTLEARRFRMGTFRVLTSSFVRLVAMPARFPIL